MRQSNLWPSPVSKDDGNVADLIAGFDPAVVDNVLTVLSREHRLPPMKAITIPPSVPSSPPTTPPSVPPSPPTTPPSVPPSEPPTEPQGCVPFNCKQKKHGHKK